MEEGRQECVTSWGGGRDSVIFRKVSKGYRCPAKETDDRSAETGGVSAKD